MERVSTMTELEQFRRSINRKMWFMILFPFAVAVFALFVALGAIARPVPVVVIDSEGHPVLFKDTITSRKVMTNKRVRGFTKEFLGHYLAINSATINEDLRAALNLMTPRFKAITVKGDENDPDKNYVAMREKYADKVGDDKNLKSALQDVKINIGKYDPENKDGSIYVLVTGKHIFHARLGLEEPVVRYFFSEIMMKRPIAGITEDNIFGLQADFANAKNFETPDDLKVYALKKGQKS